MELQSAKIDENLLTMLALFCPIDAHKWWRRKKKSIKLKKTT